MTIDFINNLNQFGEESVKIELKEVFLDMIAELLEAGCRCIHVKDDDGIELYWWRC